MLVLRFLIHGNFEQGAIARVCGGRVQWNEQWLYARSYAQGSLRQSGEKVSHQDTISR
jgi:hypothetical protein